MGIFQQFPYSNFHEMNMDEIIKIVKNMLEEWARYHAEWDAWMAEINDDWSNYQEVMNEAWQNMQDFINNYFDNLDVQNEINNKITSMVASGEFSTIVAPYIPPRVTAWLTEHITEPVGVIIDTSLSVSGACADARVTGSYIRQINGASNMFCENYNILLSKGYFRHGVYNPVTGTTSDNLTYRIGAREPITFNTPVILKIKPGFRILPYKFDNDAWIQQSWATDSFNMLKNTPYYFQIARINEDTSEVANFDEFINAVVVTGTYADVTNNALINNVDNLYNFVNNDFCNIDMETGTWGIYDGAMQKQNSSTRLRSAKLFKICKGNKIITSALKLVQFNITIIDKLLDGQVLQSSGWTSIDSTQTEKIFTADYDGYAFITCKRTSNDDISISDYTANNCYAFLIKNFPYNIPKRARHIYHFGGNGNDWCFVYTPDNYDPHRAKPYPFVICNHGNGWVMTGHPSFANWTKRTMYVPFTDPDYIADPANYNGTDDPTLYYSNPTIELLRSNGYIVCGCENYADLLYGNDNCRNACVDFFNHIINHYNVEDRCYMIGASNGGLTTLNASYILQGKIKAMILQYPITCLYNQYEANSTQAPQIDTAYNIPAGSTPGEVRNYIKTHDPLTTDVINNTKIGSIAPTKIWASRQDTVARILINSIPYKEMVEQTKVCELVEVTGGHGNYTHFDPQAFLDWFDAHK